MYKDLIDTIGFVEKADPELGAAMGRELTRQRQNIELIASENIVSPAVMAAMGSVLTNKYAEAIPATAITAAASLWTRLSRSPLTAPADCLGQNMPMCSPIPAHKPTWRSILPCWIWATP